MKIMPIIFQSTSKWFILLFFERYSGKPELSCLVFQTVFTFCTEFLAGTGSDVICILIIILFSASNFSNLQKCIYYNNLTIHKLKLISSLASFWAGAVLMLGKVGQNNFHFIFSSFFLPFVAKRSKPLILK